MAEVTGIEDIDVMTMTDEPSPEPPLPEATGAEHEQGG